MSTKYVRVGLRATEQTLPEDCREQGATVRTLPSGITYAYDTRTVNGIAFSRISPTHLHNSNKNLLELGRY